MRNREELVEKIALHALFPKARAWAENRSDSDSSCPISVCISSLFKSLTSFFECFLVSDALAMVTEWSQNGRKWSQNWLKSFFIRSDLLQIKTILFAKKERKNNMKSTKNLTKKQLNNGSEMGQHFLFFF